MTLEIENVNPDRESLAERLSRLDGGGITRRALENHRREAHRGVLQDDCGTCAGLVEAVELNSGRAVR